MINRLILILCLFFLSCYGLKAGCGKGYVRINNDVYLGYDYPHLNDTTTLFFDLNDSSVVSIHQIGSCSAFYTARIIQLVLNGSTIINTPVTAIKLKNNPGQYDVTITYLVSGNTYTETIHYYISDKMAVGLKEAGKFETNLVLAPNPASAQVRIESASAIKSVSVFDLAGKQLNCYTADGYSLTLPLDNYPPGIYMVQVAVESEKTVMKRLVVQ